MWSVVVFCGLFLGVAVAGPPEDAPAYLGPFGSADPIEAVKDKVEEKQSAEELAVQERLAKLEAAQAQKQARVVILQWQDSDVDYMNELLRRNIKTRIARPNGKFYPDVDLYQAGRKEPDPTLRPLDQRGKVPDSAIETVMAAVQAQQSIPWNALDDMEWGVRAHNLKEVAKEIWFVDRPELRTPLFLLYTQIGYAAENSNNPGPPFFEEVAGIPVNYYYYLAAAMAQMEPSLMSNLTDPTMYSNIDAIKQRLDRGDFSPMTLNFELAGSFKAEQFTTEYTPMFSGIVDQITNDDAIYNVPPGIIDVFLKRNDGYGMALRLENDKLDDQEIYGVRDQARKRMGLDFIRQLLKNPDQCIPDIDGDILNYLAIYQKLHPSAEIYIAIPYGGSVHKILLWKWDGEKAVLIRINDQTGGFPVRFVGLIGTGITISGASVKDPATALEPPVSEPGQPLPDAPNVADLVQLEPAGLPIAYELRGHWGRLMVGLGMDFSINLAEGTWREVHQTGQTDQVVSQIGATGTYQVDEQRILTTRGVVGASASDVPTVKELDWQRGVFLTVGGVFLKDAAYGFGPRLAARTGWYNAPHAVDLTAHAGWAIKPPIGKKDQADGRVFPVIDTDIFGGVMVPFRDSIFLISNQRRNEADTANEAVPGEGEGTSIWAPTASGQQSRESGGLACVDSDCTYKKLGNPLPTFGFTIKAGLTF